MRSTLDVGGAGPNPMWFESAPSRHPMGNQSAATALLLLLRPALVWFADQGGSAAQDAPGTWLRWADFVARTFVGDAALGAVDHETVQVGVGPTERHLQDNVQLGDGAISAHE
jgi:hypothetical protein